MDEDLKGSHRPVNGKKMHSIDRRKSWKAVSPLVRQRLRDFCRTKQSLSYTELPSLRPALRQIIYFFILIYINIRTVHLVLFIIHTIKCPTCILTL